MYRNSGKMVGRYLHKSVVTSVRRFRIDGETYCLMKVTEWLAANGTPRSDYPYMNSHVSRIFYNSGIYLKLDDLLKLSIQTDPVVSGSAFCETALMNDSELLHDDSLGYQDTICRWDQPENLFKHIVEIRQKLKEQSGGRC